MGPPGTTPLILADYGTSTVLHLTLALAAVAAAIYAIARAAGLADLGRRVDLDERSVGQQAQRQEQLPAQRELFDLYIEVFYGIRRSAKLRQ